MLSAFFKPLDARNLNLRFGFGILFGCPKNKENGAKKNNKYGTQSEGNCYWLRNCKKDYKKKIKKLN